MRILQELKYAHILAINIDAPFTPEKHLKDFTHQEMKRLREETNTVNKTKVGTRAFQEHTVIDRFFHQHELLQYYTLNECCLFP